MVTKERCERFMNAGIFEEALKIKTEVENKATIMRKTPKIRDYPACICSATSLRSYPIIATEISRRMKKDVVTDIMRKAFELKLGGEVGEISPITGLQFPIGQCAEQHAANSIIRDLPQRETDIIFSTCLRPRTMGIQAACLKCLTVFPQL
ncbi:MAG: hypothetical protein K2H38_03230 [Muribaculaceae bacterium]|nr:hypothetical protein [Muribaculaceae bacterium]